MASNQTIAEAAAAEIESIQNDLRELDEKREALIERRRMLEFARDFALQHGEPSNAADFNRYGLISAKIAGADRSLPKGLMAGLTPIGADLQKPAEVESPTEPPITGTIASKVLYVLTMALEEGKPRLTRAEILARIHRFDPNAKDSSLQSELSRAAARADSEIGMERAGRYFEYWLKSADELIRSRRLF